MPAFPRKARRRDTTGRRQTGNAPRRGAGLQPVVQAAGEPL